MSWLLAADPGSRSSGVALFRAGVLVVANVIVNKVEGSAGPLECAEIAHAIHAWRLAQTGPVLADLVVEWPQAYERSKSKAKADTLFPLAAIDGALAAIVGYDPRHTHGKGRSKSLPTPRSRT